MRSLTYLQLDHNQIGDAGMSELSRAVASGSMANLRSLYLVKNNIDDARMQALASVVKERLPNLKVFT